MNNPSFIKRLPQGKIHAGKNSDKPFTNLNCSTVLIGHFTLMLMVDILV